MDDQKATGSIRVYQDGADPITVPAGTTVIANEGGYQYKTVNTYVVQPGQSETISVEAVDIGDEYNVPAGTHFTIEGFDQFNSAKAYVSFAGGEKREFKAVAQDDIDKLAKDLQKSAFDEADAKIREKERDGWVLVAETVKHTLDGDVSTDKQVGAEADVVNVDISTKSSALFYNERDLLDQRDKLVQEYIDSLGSQSSEGFSWDLSQGIDAKVVLESVRDGVVKVKYSITGELQPVVDRQVIREKLAGVSWDRGVEYLKSLAFLSAEPDAEFSPSWFPRKLWYFPNNANKIEIDVKVGELLKPSKDADKSSDASTQTPTDK